ncbi:zinc-binding alcohol dehydrogenase family protein [Frondihabitans peucedani]|uniref:Enoyl reductase (ER) domain-containing protein n=1 Tax=Frondihabitans peucedani TaxID=598626 RepID=A0ABP8E604_9MICO
MPESTNQALWLRAPNGPLEVGPAPRPVPKPDEVVVRVEALAVNPADAITGILRRVATPRLRYPAVIGSDLAGVVTEIGRDVTTLHPGDRVLGFANGFDQTDSSSEGAFQAYVAVAEQVCSVLPASVSAEEAAVLPLGLATAAAGLYEVDQLALSLPSLLPSPLPTGVSAAQQAGPDDQQDVVLIWGASSSVGCNAVQLARASGFAVIATASPRNHDLVRSLGAEEVVDYRGADVDREIARLIGTRRLAGTIAIGAGSLTHCLRIARHTRGSRRIASVYPDPLTKARAVLARIRGLHVTTIWGSSVMTSPVGPAVFQRYLPAALADRTFVPAPSPEVVGTGLGALPSAIERLRGGVSGAKLVVRLEAEDAS